MTWIALHFLSKFMLIYFIYVSLIPNRETRGLILKGNPWSCDCGLVWLGHWMRRWLRESLEIHTLVLEEAQQMEDIAREATCFDQRTKQQIPIVDLHPRDLSCQASALSGDGSHMLRTRIVACVLRTLTVFAINRIAWNF